VPFQQHFDAVATYIIKIILLARNGIVGLQSAHLLSPASFRPSVCLTVSVAGVDQSTRKLSYHKDDRAKRLYYMGALKTLGSPWVPAWLCPRLFFPKFLLGFCSGRSYECAYKIWSS